MRLIFSELNDFRMIPKKALNLVSDLFQHHSVTEGTPRNKDYIWGIYTGFCQQYSENPVPCRGELMVKYAVFLILQRGCSIPTVRNRLSMIKSYHKLYFDIDVPSPSQYLPLKIPKWKLHTLEYDRKITPHKMTEKLSLENQINHSSLRTF